MLLSRVLVWPAQMVVLLGTVVYSYCLDMKFLDALYFTVVTVTTVGFGDYCPTSTSSKIFTLFYAPLAVVIVGGAISYIAQVGVAYQLHHHHSSMHDSTCVGVVVCVTSCCRV
eukprot:COSAG01_NODE_776_length_13693_cov_79.900029_17_plen_113_part_00